ncbi:MAG: hypothetical protein KZQ70_14120 [gamma proteobacterium symbiont of Lucinoma myriamae]|nr:hypothetical protein [gamma proteobacterium symbiont of Lucinoma myriamae]
MNTTPDIISEYLNKEDCGIGCSSPGLVVFETSVRGEPLYEYIVHEVINDSWSLDDLKITLDEFFKCHIKILVELIEEPLDVNKGIVVKYIVSELLNSNVSIMGDESNNIKFKDVKKLFEKKLRIQELLDNDDYDHLLHI